MAIETDRPEPEDQPEIGASAFLLQEMQLHGFRPFEDEPDDRPLPDDRLAGAAIADMFDGLVGCLVDTRIEPDLDDLLWNLVNLFQRAGERIERELDRNEQTQRRLQREQDGSEVRSVDLERATAEGITMIERRDTMEYFRDAAAEQYRIHVRKAWLPRSGSMVNRKALTSAVIDSRRQIDKRAFEDTRVLDPDGVRIAVSGGPNFNDHRLIYDTLDKVRAQHEQMVLLHGATPTGAERIAASWARDRDVPQKPFKPDWDKHQRAAPFKRNDRMLGELPKGVIVFPGTGIQDNLADKARKLGIKVWDFRARQR